ncbi:MAG: hypothetical protein EOO50_11295 [Flavobacterium sp.]|uniref:hypothetical protein n=1 Tax=Flavobacterium sp. TaxID=239 RepID=UPI0011F4E426|nr:hypothetical protein [Flavobacterium sp.]RZJ66109.1 MAG: hypothetical protein EOO50_11295 [Flavobacterium sp.]
MKNTLLLFCLFAGAVGFSQSARSTKLIADNGSGNKPTVSRHTTTETDYKSATEDELLKAVSRANADAKIAIAQELVERKSAKVADLFKSYMTSDEIVKLKLGVIEYESNPASELYVAVAHQKEKAERKKYYERTTKKGLQKELKGMFGRDYDTKWTSVETDACLAKLTAMALADDNVAPRTLNTIFYTSGYKSKNYARVKFFATKYPTAEILATLANFKNPTDIAVLTQYPQASYIAYSVYPHAAFFPTLQMNVDDDYANADFQNAISAYKNADAKTLLSKVCANICNNYALKSERDDKLFQLYSVIEKRNCRLFDSLLKKIDVLLQ